MPQTPLPFASLAAQLPQGGVRLRQTLGQLQSTMAPGERPLVLATALVGDEFGVLALTAQRVVFVEWTHERRALGRVHELPRGALRVRVERGGLALQAPRGSLAVSAVDPPAALATFSSSRGPTGLL